MTPRLSAVVGRLAVVNILTAATGFLTGPLLARALGPQGRGDLAAILVPLGLAPVLLSLALPYYANRETARGRPVNEVLGSVGAVMLVLGLIGAAFAVPAATALAEGRETVRVCLIVAFLGLPVWMLGILLMSCLQGLERWNRWLVARTIAFGVPFAAIVVLFAVGRLTVATAAAATMVAGVLVIAPAASLLAERGRPVFDAAVAREGIVMGLKTWLGGLAYTANVRLDQLVMITAVSSRELGLYAVAASLAGASTAFTSAVTPPLLTRTAAGQTILPQTLRITLLTTTAISIAIAAVTPILLRVLFGPEFGAATLMTFILLAAAIPLAGGAVIGAALQGDGAPAVPSLAEGLALVITVGGLWLTLGPLGAVGAAIVSLVAYSASFVFQLVAARRRWPASLRQYLVPSREDLQWAWELSGRVRRRSARFKRRQPSA
ncbi:oligosaccharide flippase family protein [Solirubrobacter ginsenosidimutans]|uniref:Oligosaccharide flippase family protein n=1 Tax=Solirubrobacter ginsenosidimutans TaxID=490573 RepID=A0A9X3MVX0_9ACTN|nr:oligosaccharide flippase family protein [Solirubrobacter ginsenosidimutans]MDA0163866.1 oligosaccharide flippase family protein [Solirubrobacter ginsenosidimutans]